MDIDTLIDVLLMLEKKSGSNEELLRQLVRKFFELDAHVSQEDPGSTAIVGAEAISIILAIIDNVGR